MRILLILTAFVIAQLAASDAFAQPATRMQQIKIEYDCAVYGAAFSAAIFETEPEADAAGDGAGDDTRTTSRAEMTGGGNKHCKGKMARIPPQYPNDLALQRAAPHACVFVGFDVNEQGRTENISVLKRLPRGNSKNLRKLDRASVRAVEDWCYQLKLEDGASVRRDQITTKITFEIPMDPYAWESPKTEKDASKLGAEYEKLSRKACGKFSDASKEVAPFKRSPDGEEDENVTDAAPLDRMTPLWPLSVPSQVIAHACTYVRFDVNENGAAENIKVIFRAPLGRDMKPFEDETIAAVKTWTYTPAMKGGDAVRQSGLVAKLTFEATDDE